MIISNYDNSNEVRWQQYFSGYIPPMFPSEHRDTFVNYIRISLPPFRYQHIMRDGTAEYKVLRYWISTEPVHSTVGNISFVNIFWRPLIAD